MQYQKISQVFFLSILFQIALETQTTPIAKVDLNNFEDNWDFQEQHHQEPLLGEMTKNHILPPYEKVAIHEKKSVKEFAKKDRVGKKLGNAVKSRVSCPICKLGVNLLQKEAVKNQTFLDIKKKFVSLCVAFKVESAPVCTGIFEVYGPAILPVLLSIQIGPDEICSLVLGETCGEVNNPLHEWDIQLPDTPKPEITKNFPEEGVPTFKVLHLSDTHYDPDYQEGSPANCEEPLCCREYSTPHKKEPVVPAGKWGSYQKCDSPKSLLDNMLRHIAEEHPDIDFIVWTGDLPPHDIWNQTKETNLNIIQDTVEQMFEIFPNIPIFPALGNHESIPAGNFAPPWIHQQDYSISWLYTRVADQWRKWLPATSGFSVLHGGFYSVLLRPGFRVISLNTNYCHTLSWWLLVNSTDPAKELEWLVHELQQAEDHGEKVHLVGHIPPGSTDCMKVWSFNFNRIVERYENTIQAQFYGHSHADEFEIFYDTEESKRPVGVAYLGPSVTTYENHNPAYRIYYVDGDHENSTREILDHETWTMDLEEANNQGEPKWYRLYSAKDTYNMDNLRPESWNQLLEELIEDPDLFETFYKLYYRDSRKRPPCDNSCKLQVLCDLRSARSQQRHNLCHDLELIFGD